MDKPSHDAPDRLNGWKEIAGALGKSVRSAQRWEAELGLPIERLTGPDGGQIVQASRRELEAWRLGRLQTSLATGPDEAAHPELEHPRQLSASRRSRPSRLRFPRRIRSAVEGPGRGSGMRQSPS